MTNFIGTEWLNSNSLRNYPLSQSASATATNSLFKLPDWVLLDMKLAVPYIPGMTASDFYLSSLSIYPNGFVLEIGCQGVVSLPVIAVSSPVSFQTSSSSSSPISVPLKGVSTASATYDFSQASGVVVISERSADLRPQRGTHTFSSDSGRLESSVISMGIRRISGLRVVNSGFTTPLISGQVSLQSGANHTIGVSQGVASTNLKFNAVDGGGLTVSCDCNDVELSPCIRTINNIHGDAQGNVAIVGGDCINVSTESDGISISDTCAKPCCGCNELQVVVGDVDAITSQLNTLAQQITLLASSVAQLQNICLASSMDPTSCAQDGV